MLHFLNIFNFFVSLFAEHTINLLNFLKYRNFYDKLSKIRISPAVIIL